MKKKSILSLLLAASMTMGLLAGCGGGAKEEAPTEATEAPAQEEEKEASAQESLTVTDMDGREVEIPGPVEDVVNVWPASNSVMLLAGAGDYLAGTMQPTVDNEWSQVVYPEITDVPVVDGSNVEEILALEPDLVVASDSEIVDTLIEAGVPAVNLMFSDYDTMKQSFTILGEILGGETQERLAAWCDYVDEWESEISGRLADIPEEEKPVLYYNSAQQSAALTATFAADSICQDWTETCGAVYMNTLCEDPAAGELTEEEIFSINPDVIIVGGIQQAEAFATLESSETWKEVKAVQDGKYYLAPMGMFSWCRFGMESAMMMPWLAQTLYPEEFQDIDMHQIVADFYQDFAGVELTTQQIDNMLVGLGPNEGAEGAAAGAQESSVDLQILYEEDESMINTYSLLAVNPEAPFADADGNPVSDVYVNKEGAAALINWMLSEEGKQAAAGYGVEDYGEHLFYLLEDAPASQGEIPMATEETKTIRMSTTTSVNDSGLLAYLLPMFEEKYGYQVEVFSAGTGKAIENAKFGNADLILVHSKEQEEQFIADGFSYAVEGFDTERLSFMYNYFVLCGPSADPAGCADAPTVKDAFAQIAKGEYSFVSRGDNSGTHTKEITLWPEELGITAEAESVQDYGWYQYSNAGMGVCLTMAEETGSYIFSDKATFLTFRANNGVME